MHRLYLGPDQLLASHDLDLVFDRFNSDVHHQVARHAREGLFVHAGVVGWNGRAIVLPGRSHSGKSSLVEAMVRAGALYYSDEYAVVDREGRVHPYAKPLSLRSGPHGSARTFCPPEAIGGQAGVEPLPIGLMAATRYNPGATWDIHPLSPGEAVLALLDNTVLARIRSGLALESLSRASAGIAAVAGARGEAAEAAPRLLQMLGRL